jgi:methylglyoxal synthase
MNKLKFCIDKRLPWLQQAPLEQKYKKRVLKCISYSRDQWEGDAQIATRVAEGLCQMVIFFRDPLEKHPHEPDIFMLMRICDVYDVPLATNPAAATMLLKGVDAE